MRLYGTICSPLLGHFVDQFVTCSLSDPDLSDLVQEVQRHRHSGNIEKKTGCYKKGPHCRFNYPRFPSERTIIAQPLKKDSNQTEKQFSEKKNKIKETLQKVKDVLVELEDEILDLMDTEDEILEMAGVTKEDYYEALKYSHVGAYVILKRKPNEIYINNYNPGMGSNGP